MQLIDGKATAAKIKDYSPLNQIIMDNYGNINLS